MAWYSLLNKRHLKGWSVVPVLIGALVCAITTYSIAQTTIEKYGVELQVDRVTPTGVGQSLVQIAGQEQIVSDVRLSSVVVREYLNREELFKSVSLAKVLALIEGAIKNKDDLLYDEILLAVSRYVTDADEGSTEFYQALSHKPQVSEKIQTIVETEPASSFSPTALPQFLAIVVLQTPTQNISPTVNEVIRSKTPQIRNVLKGKFFNALKDANPDLAKSILEHFTAVFGSEDPDTKSLGTVLSRLENSTSLSEFSGVLMELSAKDPELRRSLATIAIDLLHDRVEKLIEQEQFVPALHELAQVDIERRTPRTHQLATVAVQHLKYTDFAALQIDTKARDFIKYIASKDQNFRDAYILSFERNIFALFSDQVFSEELFASGFALLSDVRPDPNALNDRIRIKCIELALQSDDSSPVKFIKSDMRTTLTFIDEGNLFLLYLRYNLLIIVIAVVFVLVSAIFVLRKIRLKKERTFEEEPVYAKSKTPSSEEEQGEIEEERPLFVKGRSGNSKYPAQYVELMAEFGLNAESSLKEIKGMYRSRMKDIHPDVAGADSKHTRDFIHYQEVYERILEFRKQLGLES